MKKTFISLLFVPVSCFAFDANLVGVEYYKGDKGKDNICTETQVLVSEVYRISPMQNGLTYKSQEIGKSPTERQLKFQRENGDISIDQCIPIGSKQSKQVFFAKQNGELSNQNMRVLIDTTQSHLIMDAAKWPKLIPIK